MSHADNPADNAVSDADWRRFLERRGHGGVHDGHVQAVAPFGAFVEIDGVRGLLPRTEWTAPPEVGSTVAVRIHQVDPDNRRFSLTAA